MCCEVLPQYMYVLRAYLIVKTYVLRGVLERQTRRRRALPQSGVGDFWRGFARGRARARNFP